MREDEGAGPCPECGTTGAHAGQLVCQGCLVPFALMRPVRHATGGAEYAGEARGGTDAGYAGHADDAVDAQGREHADDMGDDMDATDALPQVGGPAGREAEHARVIRLIPGALQRAAQTRRDAPSQALRLCFPGDETVTVEPGGRVRLGRDPRLCPAVKFLAAHDNLSRLHATFGVEADGSAWITDEDSTNGTFVHGYRLKALEPAAVRPGDTVRLAADLTVRIAL
ncbi:FHA domain-containing protein [Actinacidiphila rubida]|uniref:FHA domain-containing protein n=2 Tax=Actinacidiphila rubida TaxID=310780 RepID=A0A1H8G2Q1_9ACTN|nr:FHA domain-containing protein [Actinacidiphila rubida]